jgi:plasmid stabilization system protein ParE
MANDSLGAGARRTARSHEVKQVIFRREARADALEAYRWYDEKEAGLAAEFRSELSATIRRVRQSPRAYRVLHRDMSGIESAALGIALQDTTAGVP